LRADKGRRGWLGGAVFKPSALDLDEESLAWQAEVFAATACEGFRVSLPLRAENGAVVVEGWCASEAVEGRHEERRWAEIIAVGERFHAALAGVPRPEFFAHRTDPWSVADRVAWGEVSAGEFAHVKHLPRLVSALNPISTPSQLIHGDLGSNVLFDDQLPPAVIDFSPRWRPPAFASAIVVADALVWEGADESVLDAVAHRENISRYLVRALIYRAVTDRLFRLDEPIRPDDDDPYLPAVELACRLAA